MESVGADLAASPRLFRNPFLDKLSRVHPWTPALLYGPIIALLIAWSLRLLSPAIAAGMLISGYFLWTIFEYFMHRRLFHLVLPGPLGARLHFLMHGVHHDHPNDPMRLVIPPLASIPVGLIVYIVLRLIVGPELSLPLFAGFGIGYVAYDTLHYTLHHRRPRTSWGAALHRRHMLHHFHDATRGFGISCPWWDDLLGTAPTSPRPANSAK